MTFIGQRRNARNAGSLFHWHVPLPFPSSSTQTVPSLLLKMQNTTCFLFLGQDPIWIQLVSCGNSQLNDQRGWSRWCVMGNRNRCVIGGRGRGSELQREVKRADCTSGRKLDEDGGSPPPLLLSLCPNIQHGPKDIPHQPCRAEGWPLDSRLASEAISFVGRGGKSQVRGRVRVLEGLREASQGPLGQYPRSSWRSCCPHPRSAPARGGNWFLSPGGCVSGARGQA